MRPHGLIQVTHLKALLLDVQTVGALLTPILTTLHTMVVQTHQQSTTRCTLVPLSMSLLVSFSVFWWPFMWLSRQKILAWCAQINSKNYLICFLFWQFVPNLIVSKLINLLYSLACSLTGLATFSMWLMWACIFLAQCNPMLTITYGAWDSPAAWVTTLIGAFYLICWIISLNSLIHLLILHFV